MAAAKNQFVILLFLMATTMPAHPITLPNAKPGCQKKCGSLVIPLPFGICEACSMQSEFTVTCKNSTTTILANNTHTLPLTISKFSLDVGELQILQNVARLCKNEKDHTTTSTSVLKMTGSYTISTKNEFFTLGCNVLGIYMSINGIGVTMPACYDFLGNMTKSCNGIGCSRVFLASGQHDISYSLHPADGFNTTFLPSNNKHLCDYAFIVEDGHFTFDPESSLQLLRNTKQQMVIDWTVGNLSCAQVAASSCQKHAYCVDRSTIIEGMVGYICRCSPGYEGNPYLGCEDIDECAVSSKCNNGICKNSPGNYSCACDEGFTNLDSIINMYTSQNLERRLENLVRSLSRLCGFSWTYWKVRKIRLTRLREKYFKANGGLILQQHLRHGGSIQSPRIFSAEELQEVTNNYHADKILGEGGNGVVYKGVMHDRTTVAIKKPKRGTSSAGNEFVNELNILFQINHRNVVRLLGCCFETKEPLLVYEYISRGTLFEQLFDNGTRPPLSWELRLKIASESAGALAYLHSSAPITIIHRDVKTKNILLDDSYTAKVSDFGASRFIPVDQAQITTLIQGTFGYLDPEYFQSNLLTEKSDVYSFDVVLEELLTGKVALSFTRPENERFLSNLFVSSVKDGRLNQILDFDVVNEGSIDTVEQVAKLANQCLMMKGNDIPTMREIAIELEGLRVAVVNVGGSDDNAGSRIT